jgi:hypothetical protein
MPVLVGEKDKALVRVFGPVQEITTPFFLLMHGDMRRTPRVRAFFDFVVDELPRIRILLSAKVHHQKGQKASELKTIGQAKSAMGHVWTAPAVQGKNRAFQRNVRVQPCIRPLNAAVVAAGPDVIR